MDLPLLCAIKSKEAYYAGYTNDNNSVLVEDYCGSKLIAFRGTDDLEDWWENLMVFGFGASHGTVNALAKVVRFIPKFGGDYILTGHSKGGAMAILAASVLSSLGLTVRCCYTFGSPRVYLKKNPASSLNIINYRHINDLVPYTPPWRSNPGRTVWLPFSIQPHKIDSYIKCLEYLDATKRIAR